MNVPRQALHCTGVCAATVDLGKVHFIGCDEVQPISRIAMVWQTGFTIGLSVSCWKTRLDAKSKRLSLGDSIFEMPVPSRCRIYCSMPTLT